MLHSPKGLNLYIPSDPQECFTVALSAFDGPGEMQLQSGLRQVFGTSNLINPPVEKKVSLENMPLPPMANTHPAYEATQHLACQVCQMGQGC